MRATSGVAGGYELGAGATLPPLQLADDEALAVSVALQTAAVGAVAGVEEAAVRALAKLERVLPATLRKRANALRSATSLLPRSGPRASAQVLTTLADACGEHLQVHFVYHGLQPVQEFARTGRRTVSSSQTPGAAGVEAPTKTAETQRCVEPVGLVSTGYRWYLVAWDVQREAWRTFRADRIRGEVTAGGRFVPRTPPCDGNLQEYVSRSVSIEPYEQKARIILHVPIAVAAQAISPAAGVLEPLGDESCVLSTGAPSPEVLAIHLLALGFEFEVQQPPELATYLRTLHQHLGRALRRGRRA